MAAAAAAAAASLLQSFRRLPPAAIPEMLDCCLSWSGVDHSSLLLSLIKAFPNLLAQDGVGREEEKLGLRDCGYLASVVGAICHLLKKPGENDNVLQLFICKCYIPVMMIMHRYDAEILNQIAESFIDVLIVTNKWSIIEAVLVPLFVRSVIISMSIFQIEDESHRCTVFEDITKIPELEKDTLFQCFPLPLSCYILTSILDAAMRSCREVDSSECLFTDGCSDAEKCAANLLFDLCTITIPMLSQGLEHRTCALGSLIPSIFKAFVAHSSFELLINGKKRQLSREQFLWKLWVSCRTLFMQGSSERRDAFSVLSLYFSILSCCGCNDADLSNGTMEFDIRAEPDFWIELKRGLVDKESIVRKQCLHILRTALQINETMSDAHSLVLKNELQGNHSIQQGMSKRELWADKEAKSMGVGKFCKNAGTLVTGLQRWGAFFLLYEMLEEYGTHLVEAAWNHQVTLLLHVSFLHGDIMKVSSSNAYENQMDSLEGVYDWLGVLWERGLSHDNPQVRCLVLQSFLGIELKNFESYVKLVPEGFLLGPFILGLDDPVQHKDFGVRGVYSSRSIEGATKFLCMYTSLQSMRSAVAFLRNFAALPKQHSFGRAGLMGLAKCIASAACGIHPHDKIETKWSSSSFLNGIQEASELECVPQNDMSDTLDVLRFVVESSKQHFNSNYRLQVCENILEAATKLVCTCSVSLEVLMHFISVFPREFTDQCGLVRVKVQEWLSEYGKRHTCANSCSRAQLLKRLFDLPNNFIRHQYIAGGSHSDYDDEDFGSWEWEVKRWARVLFLVIEEENDLDPLLMFIHSHGISIAEENKCLDWDPIKFLIVVSSLVQEILLMQGRVTDCCIKVEPKGQSGLHTTVNQLNQIKDSMLNDQFASCFLSILEHMLSFASMLCSIFWSRTVMDDTLLPSSVRGKLGGPCQRRLPSSMTTALLKAIISLKTVASVSSWCAQFRSDASLNLTFTFLWKFYWNIISSPACNSENAAEVLVGAYEALAAVVKELVFASPLALELVRNRSLIPEGEGKTLWDNLVLTFLHNVNGLLAAGVLARSRRAVLVNWKWLCLESLLSIPKCMLIGRAQLVDSIYSISDTTASYVYCDLVESLENAGEGDILPMLRSVRLVLGLFSSGRLHSIALPCDGVNTEMIWHLVRASWILHVSCRKRRVAPIAALLSSVLHSSIFSDENMHETADKAGPLKWFVENLLEEATKSPRTIRLAALHLTGLWLLNPKIIKYYMKELKLLSLHGSVAFDEDFEAELAENHDARAEISLLSRSPDLELTAAFINTELYARVSVAVLFYKLADMAEMAGQTDDSNNIQAAHEAGKLFLLELLDSVVNDKDLSKELYKKYSGIHRRKVRAWQMLCILSRFVDEDILKHVVQCLCTCLYRNNLPAVRQYLETFAIHVFLKFPSLAKEQLVPIFQDHNAKPQALSSYVFIAANIILHSPETCRYKHLDELLPYVIPLLTSHHHSLRAFAQILVYQVLCELFPSVSLCESMPLEKRCFEGLKSYLEENSDCLRLRASMIGYLDAFDPKIATTPAGIFSNRIEELEFECVPRCLMEEVIAFLNDVREDLRRSMAKYLMSVNDESLTIDEDPKCLNALDDASKKRIFYHNASLDFQKKATLSKHSDNSEIYKHYLEMEKEDQLLELLLNSRHSSMERMRAGRQQFILVASLVDRIPNLAGLARTCEVFKASGLVVADANILHDKQFQLISVTAEKWVPIIEVPVNNIKVYLEKKKREGFSILGLEQTANSLPLDRYIFPKKMLLVLGREKEGIPVDIIHTLDACIEIPQLGVVRSLNVHVSGAIALWEYTRQQRFQHGSSA